MQALHTVGLNPFAVTLLAESLLKSPLATKTVEKPQGFFFPVSREDCAGWAGVRITLEAVPVAQAESQKDEAGSAGESTPGCARLESEAQVVGDRLIISLRVSTLAHAARHCDYFDACAEQGTPLKITDDSTFAKSVARALNCEKEDGSTPITRMLDDAFEWVSEQGEEGVET